MTDGNTNTLEVVRLKMYFPVRRGLFKTKLGEVKSVDGVSFTLKPGETLGIVGESGCGKTTVGRCITRLYDPTEGSVVFEGVDITNLPESELRRFRKGISLIFQDPWSSLNPRMRAGDIVAEPIRIHKLVASRKDRKERVAELFSMCGLNRNMTDRYPHEFSGGQRQRLSIARAVASDPTLIVCDEPLSALDVSMQAQIINLLAALQAKTKKLSYIFISHDLLAVQYISTRVAVMYLGRIVEVASSADLYTDTCHPYSQALLSATPTPDPWVEVGRKRIILTGDVPSPLNPPSGCSFHPRCRMASKECAAITPELRDIGNYHLVACHHV